MLTIYKCTNRGRCTKADQQKIIGIFAGAQSKCSECGERLWLRVGPGWKTIVVIILILLGLAIWRFWPARASVPVVTSVLAADGTLNLPWSYQISATNKPTSYGAIGLPAGLSVGSATGLITGTPTAAGTFPITISATNASGT